MMNDDVHSLAGPYALDAVDDLERARFEEHLARCEACRRDVADFRAVAAQLGQASAAPPPPALKESVMADVRAVRQQRSITPRPARRRAVRLLLGAAAAAAAIALAVLSLQLAGARSDRDDLASINEVLTAADAATMTLSGPEGAGRLVHSASLQQSVLIVTGLPDLPAGRAYQLWYVVEGRPVPGVTHSPDAGRMVAMVGDVPSGATAIGITEEPTGGSLAPTGEMLLSATV